jgi:ankyrin repeat protein
MRSMNILRNQAGLTVYGLIFFLIVLGALVAGYFYLDYWRSIHKCNADAIALKDYWEKTFKGEIGVSMGKRDQHGRTALMWAAGPFGNKDLVRFLIAAKSEINAKDNNGRTALSFAAEQGNNSVSEELLKNGANINLADNEGKTPLMWACEKGHPKMIQLLLQRKADVQAKDKQNKTAAMIVQELAERYKQCQAALEASKK